MRKITNLFLFLFSFSLFAQESEHICSISKINHYEKVNRLSKIQYPGDETIDVNYYKLDVTLDYSARTIDGAVTIEATCLQDLDNVFFDLQDHFSLDSVKSNGSTLSADLANDKVSINFGKTYQTGEKFSVDIYYHGTPGSSGFGSFEFTTVSGSPAIWTLSEPYGSSDWWPSKDTPADKADSSDVWITASSNFVSVSNGNLVAETDNLDGTKTYKWKNSHPIAHYLISLAMSNYSLYTNYFEYAPGDTMEVFHYNYPANVNDTRIAQLDKTIDMLEVFSDLYGPYPFLNEKYGHAEFGWGGGMEHQTISSMGSYGESIVAHELAHQWFGDKITCEDWHHIWLNEGFATYSEALFVESAYGVNNYHNYIQGEMNSAKNANGSIWVQNINSVGEIFSGTRSYAKGSVVLHMLRGVVGDENFFNILKAYASDPELSYDVADTEDFQKICEDVSSMDLSNFFEDWIYGEKYPVYAYGFSVDSTSNGFTLNLTIDQTQSTNLFWMPIQIQVNTLNGSENFVVWDSLQTQTFQIELTDFPTEVLFDPDNWILKETSSKIINPSLNQGVLLVNGLDWSLGEIVYNAYQNKAFWGNTSISFWDLFEEPSEGYPNSLPDQLGNGELSNFTISNYSTILWLSDYRGLDNTYWNNLAISDYLNEGGNIILITKRGKDFINDNLRNYLGINWDEVEYASINDMISNSSDFTDIGFINAHSAVSLFDTLLTSDASELLYKSVEGFDSPKGSGVWSHPQEKGNFIYIAGRPYNFEYESLKQNLEKMLTEFLGEIVGTKTNQKEIPTQFSLSQNYPNPFNPTTTINYSIPSAELSSNFNVKLKIFDILGREVKSLLNQKQSAGTYEIVFDASNLPSGVYYYQLSANDYIQTKKMLLIK